MRIDNRRITQKKNNDHSDIPSLVKSRQGKASQVPCRSAALNPLTGHQINGDEAQGKKVERRIIVL